MPQYRDLHPLGGMKASQTTIIQQGLMSNSHQNHENAVSSVKSRGIWLPLLLGTLFLASLFALLFWLRSGSLPTVSSQDFEAARALWNNAKPDDYKIVVRVKGMQPGVYAVRVEDGIATSASYNGNDLKRQRTFGTWSVTGMFDTLARDFEIDQQHDYLLLKAEFDPAYGFPAKYERIEMRTGAHDTLQWEVTEFETKD